jgi:hypothetical protein
MGSANGNPAPHARHRWLSWSLPSGRLLLFLAVIYRHQGSVLVLAAWLIPVLLFANLATLLYVAIHFEALVARFVA